MEHDSREELSQHLSNDKTTISKLQDELDTMQTERKTMNKTVITLYCRAVGIVYLYRYSGGGGGVKTFP